MNYQPMNKFLERMEMKSLNSMVYPFEFQFTSAKHEKMQ